MKKIKKGDVVKVIAGSNKGSVATVMHAEGEFVLLKDVNIRKKAVK